MAEVNIEQSVIWQDIKDVIYSKSNKTKFEYRAIIHTEKEDVPILKISSLDIIRDYVEKVGDYINLEFNMPLGDYIYKLYQYRVNLEVTIKIIELKDNINKKNISNVITTEKFKAVFSPNENEVYNTKDLMAVNINTLNNSDFVTVKLQLLDRSLEPLRIKTTQAIYNNVTCKQFISSVLINESSKVLVDGKPSISILDFVEPDNPDIKTNLIIPQGTHLLNIPSYIHSQLGGVYNSGIGTYIQTYNNKKAWFVYPLFDTNRFDDDVEKVIFYSLSSKGHKLIDNTYEKNGKILSVVVTSDSNYSDSADVDYMNQGSGYRMTDARAFMKKPIEVTEKGPIGKRHRVNHEVITAERKDGLNYAPLSSRGLSSNPFIDRSILSMRNVARVDLLWENSDHTLLYPGMPCKYIFLNNNKIVQLKGTVIASHTFISATGGSLNDKIYKSKTGITLAVTKYNELLDTKKTTSLGEF